MNNRVIELVDYDSSWQKKFEHEKLLLIKAIGANAVNIEHIGSTSIVCLAAKPVIDILIEVSSLTELDFANEKLEGFGYEALGENGIPGRRYFQKGGNQRTHHVHAFLSGDKNLIRHRAFKEYLIAHSEIAKRYGDIKKHAAFCCNDDIERYMSMKNGFIEKYEPLALDWYGI
ncbi:GrpB family protein [Catenovulum sp. SM1970]|uniref:GrpB family protein n=1 Tax=Marinifaba aquimaris TaxID=2741323 RepID=UPI0015722551|nr:GrpB family protein [Marinifaba aquimaris]NTS78473.1 GrpB family protein [Marinifaba aquimaris]